MAIVVGFLNQRELDHRKQWQSLLMKEVYVIVAVSLFCQIVKCQDFFSLISPFFGRVVVPKEEKTGNGGSLVQEFVKLGTNIGQRLLQVKNSHSKSQNYRTDPV
ncbi:hypothetical protein WUBG_04222 [Wuchereria bancrofti]|uniref:Uncharacterized protein n=1 Tax=Wuchereria bancrofti TaxID=6293 RepID=J9BCE6_WUCBA|nr:hypothetical protein WUBG_04222 [Wuchereria bancrofti]